jgi:hypothetical protein
VQARESPQDRIVRLESKGSTHLQVRTGHLSVSRAPWFYVRGPTSVFLLGEERLWIVARRWQVRPCHSVLVVTIEVAEPAFSWGITRGETLVILIRKRRRRLWSNESQRFPALQSRPPAEAHDERFAKQWNDTALSRSASALRQFVSDPDSGALERAGRETGDLIFATKYDSARAT